MDGDAMTVRGGDASRGGIGVSDALKLQLADIAVDRVGLAAAGLAGEEDARPEKTLAHDEADGKSSAELLSVDNDDY
jgi:hypothetical protein